MCASFLFVNVEGDYENVVMPYDTLFVTHFELSLDFGARYK